MATYRVGGRTAATAATADNAACAVWNPSSTVEVWVWEIKLFAQGAAPGAGSGFKVRRISARGTATTTVTPTIDNGICRLVAPRSGAVLDLAYSAQPTFAGPDLDRYVFGAVQGSGAIAVFPEGVMIPPGQGLAVATPGAILIPVSDVSAKVSEGRAN